MLRVYRILSFFPLHVLGYCAILAAAAAITVQSQNRIIFKFINNNYFTVSVDKLRDTPLEIRPRVAELLSLPPAEYDGLSEQIKEPKTGTLNSSYCLHLLRIHGLNARTGTPDSLAGESILKILIDNDVSQKWLGKRAWVRTRSGVRFPTITGPADVNRDSAMEHHRDQTLAAFGELGLPLSTPLSGGQGSFTLRAVLQDSLANFHIEQEELAWTALAYALYLPPVRSWVNRFGERSSFDDLVLEMIGRPLDLESCAGSHLLHSLAIIGRTDRQQPVLSKHIRSELDRYLSGCAREAVRVQAPDGSFAENWCYNLVPNPQPRRPTIADTAEGRVVATGHLTEWLLALPDDIAVPDQTLRLSGEWLRQALARASRNDKEMLFCPYTHAVCVIRSLARSPESKAHTVTSPSTNRAKFSPATWSSYSRATLRCTLRRQTERRF